MNINYKGIIEGIKNTALDAFNLLPKSNKELIEKRVAICKSCPFNSENAKTSLEWSMLFYDTLSEEDKANIKLEDLHYDSMRFDLHCSLCACNIDLKTKCIECKCGIEEYNKQYNKQIEELW